MKDPSIKADLERSLGAALWWRKLLKRQLMLILTVLLGILFLISIDNSILFCLNEEGSSVLYNELENRYRNGFYRVDFWKQIGAVDLKQVAVVDMSSSHVGCDFSVGKWVKDKNRPLYSGETCKQWLSGMWACRLMSGRPDFDFENYRWQPDTCDLPAFSAHYFLSRMQNKVLAFVGDSIGRQQYQSLMCMLTGGKEDASVEDVSYLFGLSKLRGAIRPDGTAQHFKETNTTIIYYWSATLCEVQPLNRSDPNTEFAMHLDRPATFIQSYLDKIDVLILNTAHHWNRGKMNANKWIMHVNGKPTIDKRFRDLNTARNFTVHKVIAWLDEQVLNGQTKAQIYMRSLSPRHFFHGEWDSGGRCDDRSVPIDRKNITGRVTGDPAAESAVLGKKVHLLNITYLSQFRDEAHLSKYRPNQSGQDCLHWCLPGVPDVWNEVLYAELLFRNSLEK